MARDAFPKKHEQAARARNQFFGLKMNFIRHFFLLFFFLTHDLQAKEDNQLMENQTFWEWNRPEGAYQVHFIERGTGPHHILLIHGFAANSYTWRHQVEALAHAGYHVWTLDLLGFGYSDKPTNIPYGVNLFVSQIDEFMKAKSIASADIVGNSMGGGLALVLAIKYPKKVRSLILIDALAFQIKLPFYFAMPKWLGSLTKPFFGRTMVEWILKDMMNDPKKMTEEQITAYALPLQMQGGKDAFINTLKHADAFDWKQLSSHYNEINIPILIIWGENDRLMPLSYQQRVFQAFPRAQKIIIPHCGHIPQEECPLQVNQAILNFLSS